MDKSQLSINNDPKHTILSKYGFSEIRDDLDDDSSETTPETKPIVTQTEERSKLLAQIEETQKTIAELEQYSSRKRNQKKNEYFSKNDEFITIGDIN
jgi:hypothetical protein